MTDLFAPTHAGSLQLPRVAHETATWRWRTHGPIGGSSQDQDRANEPDRATFYGGDEKGYTDCPALAGA